MSNRLRKGEVVCIDYGLFKHYGIVSSDNTIIHYSGLVGKARVEEVTVREFSSGKNIYVDKSFHSYNADAAIKKARSRIGEENYCVLNNNCEDFVVWCTGCKKREHQIPRLVSGLISLIKG